MVVPLKRNPGWFLMAEPVLGYSNTFVIVIWHDLPLFLCITLPCITLPGPFIPGNVAIPITFLILPGPGGPMLSRGVPVGCTRPGILISQLPIVAGVSRKGPSKPYYHFLFY
jgi:hypothetical protein